MLRGVHPERSEGLSKTVEHAVVPVIRETQRMQELPDAPLRNEEPTSMISRRQRAMHSSWATALTALALLLSVSGPPPVVQAAHGGKPGNQGLQGGWAIDDSGSHNAYHSTSPQLPIIHQAGAGWV